MTQKLKQAINSKLESHSLSDEQLNTMHALLSSKESARSGYSPRPWYAAIASVLAVVAVLVYMRAPVNQTDMPQLIAEEVIRNHLKLKPLEVKTDSIDRIRAHFDKLGFAPISSENISNISSLLGGRYCSIQGYTAAQLRMINPETGNLDTVYQAPYIRSVFGDLPDISKQQKPLEVYERGIKVSIWVEKGILFARTHVDEIK